MTFQEAKDLAIEFGAKLPKFDHTSLVAQCWIDRITTVEMLICNTIYPMKQVNAAIAEANRYAG